MRPTGKALPGFPAWDRALNFPDRELVIDPILQNIQVRDSTNSLDITCQDLVIFKNYKVLA